MGILEEIAACVLAGDEVKTPMHVRQALADRVPARRVLDDGLLAGMNEVGRRFREGEYFIPEVLIAAEAMKAAMTILRPALTEQGVAALATAAIGTVRGDLHDIGKNLVSIMLEGAGFDVVDLGVDVTAETFIDACRRQKIDLVAMSALLTTTMPEMEIAIKSLREALKPCPPIIIGGAPVTQAYAERIGADGYGRDAATGAEVARKLCRM
ncbi:MAG: Glutamate mutase sigma subunit [Phycisphaerae bacterium]|nr:Glutamate mutase sigma subunit [Phycisphaerae bacterium]